MAETIQLERSTFLHHYVLRAPFLYIEETGQVINLTSATFKDVPYDNFAITGYFCAFFELDKSFIYYLHNHYSSFPNLHQSELSPIYYFFINYIAAINIPNYSLEKSTWVGNNEIRYHYPTKKTISEDSFSLSLYDTADFKYQQFFQAWIHACFLNLKNNGEKVPIKGNLCLSIFDPRMHMSHFSILFLGIFPTDSNLNTLSFDITNNELYNFSVNFSFDRIIISKVVNDKVNEKLKVLNELEEKRKAKLRVKTESLEEKTALQK